MTERVRLALGSPAPGLSAEAKPLSTETINNVRITADDGVVPMRGNVTTSEEKEEIENLARSADGVRKAKNELEMAPPKPTLPQL